MLRFRWVRRLPKFVADHASFQNHFNQECHLYSRNNFKLKRDAALAEWSDLGAAKNVRSTVFAEAGSHLSDNTISIGPF